MSLIEAIRKHNRISDSGEYDRIRSIDMHTCGEPLRVILEGYPKIEGETILEKRAFVSENLDHLRTALMHEPRGHADMYGCILLPPDTEESDLGVLFMHNEGYSTMCGHATIAIMKLAVEMNWTGQDSSDTHSLKLDAPCGRVEAFAETGTSDPNCWFHGVPSFVLSLDNVLELPDFGEITYDIAYGGAFYAYVDANQLDLELSRTNYSKIRDLGIEIKKTVLQKQKVTHPFEEELSFLYGTIFIQQYDNHRSRNVCVFADGEVDRSPTGSGVSGRLAIHRSRGELAIGEEIEVESILGTTFKAEIIDELIYGPHHAVIPKVAGKAYITGQHEFLVSSADPLKHGFFLS